MFISFSFVDFPCVFSLLPDRTKITYQKLFQELKYMAVSMNRIFKPDQLVTNFESGLGPAIFADVKSTGLFFKNNDKYYRFIFLVS